ncbi:actin cytoskeleton and mitosis protein [Cryptotrichosporon argae]
MSALAAGDPDADDDGRKSSRLAARAARFNNVLPGNRYKELEEARAKERGAFEAQGLVQSGKTELGSAVDMRGTCEAMCCEYEREFREYTKEIHPFEATPNRRMDHSKAVAAYTRSDAGAGHGTAAILPSDLRTPAALVRTLDYLINDILPLQPPATSPSSSALAPPGSHTAARRALGYTAGFIRDRTRAIRKEFAMQSSWGHVEAVASFERVARWHVLCLRELQEETGNNVDMHIDAAELGRCFTSLRQQYNDRREETGLDVPCPNEPEFRAYMLIFDLANKSTSIPTSELPAAILDHPLVRLAWALRAAAQRNFDSQKEGSKLNAELGLNMVARYVRLLRGARVPFLFACLAEVRLREMRRSALRALTRTYPRLKADPIRRNERGDVVERRMVLLPTLARLLGCEQQEDVEPAWDDVEPVSTRPEDEAAAVARRFGLEVYEDETGPAGAMIHLGAPYNDNKDAPFTRRWKLISDKKGAVSYADIINGKAGIHVDGAPAPAATVRVPSPPAVARPSPLTTSAFSFKPAAPAPPAPALPVLAPAPTPAFTAFSQPVQVAPVSRTPARAPVPPFSFIKPAPPKPEPSVMSVPAIKLEPAATPPQAPAAATRTPPPLFSQPAFFSQPQAGPSQTKLAPPPVHPVAPASAPVSVTVSPPLRPLPSPRKTLVQVPRAAYKRALPRLTDELVGMVVAALIDSSQPELERLVRHQTAALAYADARDRRRAEIDRFARLVADAMLADAVSGVVEEALDEVAREKVLEKKVVARWRSFVESQRSKREAARWDREDVLKRLRGMGLSRAGVAGDYGEQRLGPGKDEMELDVELRQAEREKDDLFAPASFLVSIARTVGPLFADELDDELHFATLLLTAERSPSAAPPAARAWLAHKFLTEDGEGVEVDGVDFTAAVAWDARGPDARNVGVVVFEAPLRSLSGKEAQEAVERLRSVERATTGRFRTALLVLTWDDESLDEVVERLGIQDEAAAYAAVLAVSLERPEGLGERFAQAVRTLFTGDPRRTQVVVDLDDVVDRFARSWERLVDITRLAAASNPRAALTALQAGVDAFVSIPAFTRSATHSAHPRDLAELGVADLPPVETRADAVGAIVAFFSADVFCGLDDLALAVGALRRAAETGKPLPMAPVLESLALFVLDELRPVRVALADWRDTHQALSLAATHAAAVAAAFEHRIVAAVRAVAATPPATAHAQANGHVVPTDDGAVQGQREVEYVERALIPPKRARDTDASPDTKAAKSVRLRRALDAARRTMAALEAA